MLMRSLAAAGASVFIASFPAIADEHRGLEAHVHGEAELMAAVDGDWLVIELRSPLANFVGFEHAPRSDEEQAALDAALEDVTAGVDLIVPNEAAACRLARVAAEGPSFDDADTGEHAGTHLDDHEHGRHDHESHAEIVATYSFQCGRMPSLEAIALPLFDAYPGMTAIDATFISDEAQIFRELGVGETFDVTK